MILDLIITFLLNQHCRHTTTKYTFNIKGVLVFTSAQKIPEGKDIHCEFLHQLT